jgi:hypothetical protein
MTLTIEGADTHGEDLPELVEAEGDGWRATLTHHNGRWRIDAEKRDIMVPELVDKTHDDFETAFGHFATYVAAWQNDGSAVYPADVGAQA